MDIFSNPIIDCCLAYIDPSIGQQIFQSLGPFWGMVLAFLAILLWPLKFFYHLIKKYFKWVLLLLLLGGVAAYIFYSPEKVSPEYESKKVIVLGMDGMDPDLIEKYMNEGILPNFSKLKNQGSYSRFGTVYPPQSPVAWSTFATGLNPGGHRLFDFIWRHTHNYMPDLALAEFKKEKIKIFGFKTPLENARYVSRRKGDTFWKLTSEKSIPTSVIHCPVTFPAEKVSHAMLSGMGVPDLRGTQGMFTYFTTEDFDSETAQGGLRKTLSFNDNIAESSLSGPYNHNGIAMGIPMTFTKGSAPGQITIKIQNQEILLRQELWSDWIRVKFKLGNFSIINGMLRFYLKSTTPEVQIYASPLNFTPEKPAQPISYPNSYAKKLKDAIGDFHTLGMPHDTWALNEGAMNEDMFLEQSQTILNEEKRMLDHELKQFEKGLFVFVIETPDRIQHMFWRAIDKQNPTYTPAFAAKYGNVIRETYQQMDEMLERVLAFVDENTHLMVISDHGFKSFRRAIHLNSWLRDNDYLVFDDDHYYYEDDYEYEEETSSFFSNVDWSQSRAYAIGLGSIYLNLKGREQEGSVNPEDAINLQHEIREKLKKLKDKNVNVVHEVYLGQDIFEGDFIEEAPDLLVAFNEGYRASWQTALGSAPEEIIEDNLKRWSGDHIIDPKLVPGIFFSNHRIKETDPSLYDIFPTIMKLFGLEVPEDRKGRALF